MVNITEFKPVKKSRTRKRKRVRVITVNQNFSDSELKLISNNEYSY